MSDFTFKSAPWVPFQDREACERVRKISGKDLEKHPNKNFKIHVTLNPGAICIADMFARIKESDEKNKKVVMILGNPNPGTYSPVAELINYHRISCRNLVCFTMDEWADQDGNIAPVTYQSGFSYSFLKYFINAIDKPLRPPMKNVHYPTTKSIKDYSKMITDEGEGGADIIYSGPGWAGHVAFIDPCPELIPGYAEGGTYTIKSLKDDYFKQDAQVVTLHPLTIAQNSLHGVFGCSGDIADVPPKAATIGPADVMRAKERMEFHSLTTMGSISSWQRMTSRLILHGPVTPYVPGSMLQLLDTTVYVSESIAMPFDCWETVGY